MRPHTWCWASLVLLLSAPAHAHLIKIPVDYTVDSFVAPLVMDGGTLTAVDGAGHAATEFRNMPGGFVFGVRGSYPNGTAALILTFDQPVTSVELWAGLVERGNFYVELWDDFGKLTTTASDTLFPGGGSLPSIINVTPPEPATKLVIRGSSWLNEPTFWRAEVVWAVPEPSGMAMLAVGLLISTFCGCRRRCPPVQTP